MISATELECLLEAREQAARPLGPILARPPIFSAVRYDELKRDAKLLLAKFLVLESCPVIGRCGSNGDLPHFLREFSVELASSPDLGPFRFRSKEPIAFAVRLVADHLGLEPAAAVGSVFLSGQIERFFRELGGCLGPDGRWLNSEVRAQVGARLNRNPERRVNDIAKTYKVFLLNETNKTVQQFLEIEAKLPETWAANEAGERVILRDIGERIQILRHPAAHGFFSDLSAEGLFYASLYAIIFFSLEPT